MWLILRLCVGVWQTKNRNCFERAAYYEVTASSRVWVQQRFGIFLRIFHEKSFYAKILGVFHAEVCSPRGTTIDVNFLMVSRVIFYTLECCLRNMGKLDALRSAKQSEPKRKCEFLKSLLMLLEFQSHISDICIVGAQLGLKSVA